MGGFGPDIQRQAIFALFGERCARRRIVKGNADVRALNAHRARRGRVENAFPRDHGCRRRPAQVAHGWRGIGNAMVSPATRILRLAHAEDSTPGYRHLQPDPLQVLFNFHFGLAGALGPPRHRNIRTCR